MDSTEIKDLLISVIALSLAFTIALTGGIFRKEAPSLDALALLFTISAFTIGIGFVLHELAHKYMAIRYGCWAAFRAWPTGLQLALLTSLFGIVFAAPGATMIYTQHLTRRASAMISIVGPLTNVFLAFLFVFASPFIVFLLPIEIAGMLLYFGIKINLWLAFFNMLPFGPLDGKKIMAWNFGVWALLTGGIFIILFILPLEMLVFA